MIIASKHFPRIITGAVLVSVLGTALYLSGPYLFGLLLLFTLVGLWEFYAMFWPLKANIGGRILGLALGGLLITAAWMRPEMVVMALALSTLILACMFLFCWSHDDKYRFTRVAVLAGGAAVRSHADHARPEFFHSRATAAHLYGGGLGHGGLFLRYALRQT